MKDKHSSSYRLSVSENILDWPTRRCFIEINKHFLWLCLILLLIAPLFGQTEEVGVAITKKSFDPAVILWYEAPAGRWEEALPVGNGRLGAMVFGKPGEER